MNIYICEINKIVLKDALPGEELVDANLLGRVIVFYADSALNMLQVINEPGVIKPIPTLEDVSDIFLFCAKGYSWSVDTENNVFELKKN